MLLNYASVLVFLIFAFAFAALCLFLPKLLAPRVPTPEKAMPYECGEEPIGTPWIQFNSRYFVYALLFLVFEVEVVFMFPAVTIFRQWVEDGLGLIALVEVSIFIAILLAGLIYVWKKGDLSWIRTPFKERA